MIHDVICIEHSPQFQQFFPFRCGTAAIFVQAQAWGPSSQLSSDSVRRGRTGPSRSFDLAAKRPQRDMRKCQLT